MRQLIGNPNFLALILIIAFADANGLSHCCASGKKHFDQSSACTEIKLNETTTACILTASICCMNMLLEHSCNHGIKFAKKEAYCSSSIGQVGGGIRKECCECCLLAKELLRKGESCKAPDGFGTACLRSFHQCCSESESKNVLQHHHYESHSDIVDLLSVGDRCTSAKCEHMCTDRGGNTVECSCHSGYELAPDGYSCIDVDECNLGSHDCGPLYQCRNTQGSYRCDPKKCSEGELMNPRTGECTSMDCPIGYKPIRGRCEDVNECEIPGRCSQFEECINTPGSFRCQERGNLCTSGYRMDRDTGFCVDINECADGTHFCGDKQCINLLGSYKCRCSAGFEFNDTTKRCEDVDECKKFAGHVCSLHATCENTHGSFKCHCKDGFAIAKDARNCDDIDECKLGIANCAQKCINIPGSYQCICERGFRLGADGVTCEDIDECTLWAGSGDDLCMGSCINTPGSYKCQCPIGYEIQEDGRTCKDIDECSKGECQGNDQICVNTLGSFKCHVIHCPPNYVHDKNYKNLVDDGYSCLKRCRSNDPVCISNHTREILYQFRSLPSIKYIKYPIEVSRVRAQMDTPFSVKYRIDKENRDKFMVQQERNIGIVKVTAPIEGPRTIVVKVHLNTYSRSYVLLTHNIALITIYVSPYFF